jgi:hypothetical protein
MLSPLRFLLFLDPRIVMDKFHPARGGPSPCHRVLVLGGGGKRKHLAVIFTSKSIGTEVMEK